MDYNAKTSEIWTRFRETERALRANLELDIQRLRAGLAPAIAAAQAAASAEVEALNACKRAEKLAPPVLTPEQQAAAHLAECDRIAKRDAEERRKFDLKLERQAEMRRLKRVEEAERQARIARARREYDEQRAAVAAEDARHKEAARIARAAEDERATRELAAEQKRYADVTAQANAAHATLRDKALTPGLPAAERDAFFQQAADAYEATFREAGFAPPTFG